MIDLHVHTSLCGHASGSVRDYVEAAGEAGVGTLCFTDHLPLPDGFPSGYSMTWTDLPAYVHDVRDAAERSAREGGPEVLVGIEADWLPGHEMLVAGATRAHPFDFVLGSVHFIDGWAFDDPDEIAGYAEWTYDALWARYFDDLAAAASSGLFDAMAHPDLIKKFGGRPESDPGPWYEEIAAVLAECGVAVEVSTAGLRKPCAEIYPAPDLLAACRRHGVAATMGSDAHAPEDVGYRMDAARQLLLEVGYGKVLVWRDRVPREVPL
ncbi:MAG TPA: histidinol-phosphatase HisJ family protein [Coriobacteriia bacterium]